MSMGAYGRTASYSRNSLEKHMNGINGPPAVSSAKQAKGDEICIGVRQLDTFQVNGSNHTAKATKFNG